LEVVLIGTGKLAFVLGQNILAAGHTISQVVGRNKIVGKQLSEILITPYSDLDNITPNADFYIILTSDSAIFETSKMLENNKGIVIHCSGNTSIHALDDKHHDTGVLYPLDSFPNKEFTTLKETPILIEGSNSKSTKVISTFANTLSGKVLNLTSEQRKVVHLSAVLTNNFITYLVIKAKSRLKEEGINEEILNKLLTTTYTNSLRDDYRSFQTGPALRDDTNTIEDHIKLLKNDKILEKVYKLISADIDQTSN